jgi:pyruvyl transferase EpsI
MKKHINFRKKFNVLLAIQKFKKQKYFKDSVIDKTKKQAYIFLAADYGNLGDVAITYAQTVFLKKNSSFQVIEIPISQSLEGLLFVKKHIKKGDVVTTVGGGNMGNLYDQIEYIRQLTFKFFLNNKIISFPQTFDFSSSEDGIKALEAAKKIYNSHPDLHLIAREKTSFELMKKHFPGAKVILTPDIVLSLNITENKKFTRKGALICMRKDEEKALSNVENDYIINEVHQYFSEVKYYDTHVNKNHLTIDERDAELKKIWETFKTAELVITDRLHGMIFCYITGTPCFVFQNNNHKVRETYEWIKNNPNIKLMKGFDQNEIQDFLKAFSHKEHYYNSLESKYEIISSLF